MRFASDTDPRAILAISPFASPDARLIASICEAGALCVLDLGADPTASLSALVDLKRWTDRPFGLRVGPACGLDPTTIRDSGASLLLLAPQTDLTSLDSLISQSRQGLPADVLVEVRDLTEARAESPRCVRTFPFERIRAWQGIQRRGIRRSGSV